MQLFGERNVIEHSLGKPNIRTFVVNGRQAVNIASNAVTSGTPPTSLFQVTSALMELNKPALSEEEAKIKDDEAANLLNWRGLEIKTLTDGFEAAIRLSAIGLCSLAQASTFERALVETQAQPLMSKRKLVEGYVKLKQFTEALNCIAGISNRDIDEHQKTKCYEILVNGLCKDNQRERAFEVIRNMENHLDRGYAILRLINYAAEDIDFRFRCISLHPVAGSDSQIFDLSSAVQYCMDDLGQITKGREMIKKSDELLQASTSHVAVELYVKAGDMDQAYKKALTLQGRERWLGLMVTRNNYGELNRKDLFEEIDKKVKKEFPDGPPNSF